MSNTPKKRKKGKERSGLSDRVHLRDANLARDQECYLTKNGRKVRARWDAKMLRRHCEHSIRSKRWRQSAQGEGPNSHVRGPTRRQRQRTQRIPEGSVPGSVARVSPGRTRTLRANDGSQKGNRPDMPRQTAKRQETSGDLA